MKKRITILLAFLSLLGITACGNTMPTVDEVLQKAIEADKRVKSFSLDIVQTQTLTVDHKTQESKVTTMRYDYTKEPIGSYFESSIYSDEVNLTKKMYRTDEGTYFLGYDGQWRKLLDDSMNPTQIQKDMDLSELFRQIKMYANEANIISEGNDYIVTVSLENEKAKEAEHFLWSESPSQEEDNLEKKTSEQKGNKQIMLDMKNIVMKYRINKDNYFLISITFEYTKSGEESGRKIEDHFVSNSTYTRHNVVPQIKVPQHIINSAQ
ncbi:hypothetical protein RQP50_24400 [Paenibacillus sp. chi10]|uniref:Lipoprotein n=1 Tax=Paenibacillus suaedae TaxID=3077233 RepID=A0AAJ2K0Y0_9BACL|nr:DUF6612 family protein [Paenibacillus sp. chi10]MDT8979384.1 hypothetical protein [Paenibacillus sp. chi10]